MDIRKIKKLIELVEESGISELEISEGEEDVYKRQGNGRLLVQSRPAAAEHLFNQRTPADVTASFLR